MHKIGIHNLIRKFFKDTLHHRFNSRKYILLLNKAHFQIKLVKFTRAAISAAIFITETGCNLEIAIKARHHNQLLKLLRGLWQGIEFTGMQTGRHQKITGTFWRRGCQNRRLEFGESLRYHTLADRLNHLCPQHDIGMWTGAAQIKIAIAKPCLFTGILIRIHLQRQRISC